MDKIRSGEAFEGDIKLTIAGDQLRTGDAAPDFTLDALAPGEALPREVTLAGGAGRVRLLHVVNSLDTRLSHRCASLRAAADGRAAGQVRRLTSSTSMEQPNYEAAIAAARRVRSRAT